MHHIKAPSYYDHLNENWYSIFLAGSIEMGKAEDWQQGIVEFVKHQNDKLVILNPRRDNWDSSWKQDKDSFNFRSQVTWELGALEKADLVVFYFDPNTKSPVSLLELGLFANKSLVCCPEGFWRKGNVDVVCERYNIQTVDSLRDLKLAIVKKFREYEIRV
jgi:hypothetical protein